MLKIAQNQPAQATLYRVRKLIKRVWDAHSITKSTVRGTIADFFLTLLVVTFTLSLDYAPLSLFIFNPDYPTQLWAFAAFIPMLMRRRDPQKAAYVFVAITIAQFLVGPVFIETDILCVFILYSGIVNSSSKIAMRLVKIAYALVLIFSIELAISDSFGSLLAPQKYYDGLNVCNINKARFDANRCGFRVSSFAIVFMLIGISVISITIIIAFWQLVSKRSVSLIQERTKILEKQADDAQNVAEAAERARIARDMHDVVAHTLSTIIIQADGGRYAAISDRNKAREILHLIEHEGTQALNDMSQLGILQDSASLTHTETLETTSEYSPDKAQSDKSAKPYGSDKDNKNQEPTSLIPRVNKLVESARITFPPQTITQTILSRNETKKDPAFNLSSEGQETAYRVVQESLTNARKYAGKNASITIIESWESNQLRLTIADTGSSTPNQQTWNTGGYGLKGMRERVEKLGGRLVSQYRQNSNGFIVEATLPYASVNADTLNLAPFSLNRFLKYSFSWISNQESDEDASYLPLWIRFIERIASSSAQHYKLIDSVFALILIAVCTPGDIAYVSGYWSWPLFAISVLLIAPLTLRRSNPLLSMSLIFFVTALQTVFLGTLILANISILISLYSIMVYGKRTWRWKIACCTLALCTVMGVSFMYHTATAIQNDFNGVTGESISVMFNGLFAYLGVFGSSTSMMSTQEAIFNVLLISVFTTALCSLAMTLGLWARQSETNMLLLSEQEKALSDEYQRAVVVATNRERENITSHIQDDIVWAISSVRTQTSDALLLLDSESTTDEQIAQMFSQISSAGRKALAHMRELLGILRDTEYSDSQLSSRPRTNTGTIKLEPAPPLHEQLSSASQQSLSQ